MSIIGDELKAVQSVLGATAEIGYTGVYTLPEYASSGDRCYPLVVLRSADRSNTPANASTRDLLEWFRPEVVLVVGIGGGIKRGESGPDLGDVVIGRYVHYAPYSKDLPSGNLLRYISLDQPSSRLVAEHANPLADGPLQACFSHLAVPRPGDSDSQPKIHVSEVVVSESIAGNPSAEKQIEMVERFDNADVVDMESMGVGRALHDYRADPHYSPLWLPVRGISDIVRAGSRTLGAQAPAEEAMTDGVVERSPSPDNGEPEDNNDQRTQWKEYASHAAACVAYSLAERLLSDDRPASEADPGAPRWRPGQLPNGMSVGA